MYGNQPPPPPPGPRPTVDLDDLFGVVPSAPLPQQQQHQQQYYSPPPPSQTSTGNGAGLNDLPPPPYWEDGKGQSSSADIFASPLPPPPPQPQHPQQQYSNQYYQPQPQPQPTSYPSQPQAQPQPQPQAQPQPQPQPQQPARTPEDEDREQLEKIIRLRKELEAEQQREHDKKCEMETWACPQCTFRTRLSVGVCEMCGTHRPGYAPSAPQQQSQHPPPQQQSYTFDPVKGYSTGPAVHVTATAPRPPWQCGMCLAPNGAADDRCHVCSAFRSSALQLSDGATHQTHAHVHAPQSTGVPNVQSRTPFTTNWRCSVCGRVNAPSKANCEACNGFQHNGTPVPGGVLKHAGGAGPKREGGTGPGASDGARPTVWECSVCTLENSTKDAVCVACRSGQRPRHLAPPAAKSVVFSAEAKSGGKGRPPSSSAAGNTKTKWPCPQCTFHNSLRRSKCDMCGAARPERYAPAASERESTKEAKKREDDSDEDEVQWQSDTVARECNRCHQEFGFMRRRHHCRACGYVFCAVCSPFYLELKKNQEAVRMCVGCYEARQKKK